MNLPKRLIRNSDSSHCSTAFCAVCSEHLVRDVRMRHYRRGIAFTHVVSHIAGVVNKDE